MTPGMSPWSRSRLLAREPSSGRGLAVTVTDDAMDASEVAGCWLQVAGWNLSSAAASNQQLATSNFLTLPSPMDPSGTARSPMHCGEFGGSLHRAARARG